MTTLRGHWLRRRFRQRSNTLSICFSHLSIPIQHVVSVILKFYILSIQQQIGFSTTDSTYSIQVSQPLASGNQVLCSIYRYIVAQKTGALPRDPAPSPTKAERTNQSSLAAGQFLGPLLCIMPVLAVILTVHISITIYYCTI